MRSAIVNKTALEKLVANSPFCQGAIKELELAGYKPGETGPDGVNYDQVLESIAVFSTHRNTMSSMAKEIEIVRKLCDRELLSPLTLKDDEWRPISNDGSMQNIRRSTMFKDKDGRIFDTDAFVCKPIVAYRHDTKKEDLVDKEQAWHGRIFEVEYKKYTGFVLDRVYITNTDGNYVPRKTVEIPVFHIEYAKNRRLFATLPCYIRKLHEYPEYETGSRRCESLKGVGQYEITADIVKKAYKELGIIY